MPPFARGTTLIDLVALMAAALVLGPTIVPAVTKPQELARRQKDALQIGRLMGAFNQFASEHNGWYPLPGDLDVGNWTVSPGTSPESKNNTGNIMSLLIFNGYVTPQMMISPAESSTATVTADEDYQYRNPSRATQPARALWDPAFAGTPTDSRPWSVGVGNQSYAHQMLFGARRAQWRTTIAGRKPILGNRGPQYAPTDGAPRPASGEWTLINGLTGRQSNTLLIHGPRNTWEGHVAFNDGSVQYTERPDPLKVLYQRVGVPASAPDNIFVNESDEVGGDQVGRITQGRNTFMRPVAAVQAIGTGIIVTYWRD